MDDGIAGRSDVSARLAVSMYYAIEHGLAALAVLAMRLLGTAYSKSVSGPVQRIEPPISAIASRCLGATCGHVNSRRRITGRALQ
jgi:hypothetical protein